MKPARPGCDFRSDTCTRPTPAMRKAIAEAEVGDDVFGEDPTVNRLEALAAERLGKEAAIFLPSGTMGNQISLLLWTRPGDEVLIHEDAHVIHHENGGAGANAGINLRSIPGENGAMQAEVVKSHIRPRDVYHASTSLLMVENTANMSGGLIIPLERMKALYDTAKSHGLAVHLDGARLFNAAIGSDHRASEIASNADSVSFCISKGLGAPVGSLLCAPAEQIQQARRFRARLGGAWRQAGILAAAGIYALENHVERLAEDHRRARRLAESIEATGAYQLDHQLETNMFYLSSSDPKFPGGAKLVDILASKGILINATAANQVRFVTHLDIDDAGIDHTKAAFQEIASSFGN